MEILPPAISSRTPVLDIVKSVLSVPDVSTTLTPGPGTRLMAPVIPEKSRTPSLLRLDTLFSLLMSIPAPITTGK
jgi:hypothetical protein